MKTLEEKLQDLYEANQAMKTLNAHMQIARISLTQGAGEVKYTEAMRRAAMHTRNKILEMVKT